MFISNKVMSPLFRIIKKHVKQRMQRHSSHKIKGKQFVGLIDFERKKEFIAVSTTKDYWKKYLNLTMAVSYYFLFIDRVLELCGSGENVILIAEKENDL